MGKKRKKRMSVGKRRKHEQHCRKVQKIFAQRRKNYDHAKALYWRDVRAKLKSPAPLQRWDYAGYIQGPAWKATRQAFFASKLHDGVCVVCLAVDSIHVHHRTYRRLGCEKLQDLELLCEACHAAAHDFQHKAEAAGRKYSLAKVARKLRAIKAGRYPTDEIPEGWNRPAQWKP